MFSPAAFRKLLDNHPDLCAPGLAGPETCRSLGLDHAAERRQLEEAFDQFAACCDWLLDCTPMRRVSCLAPSSADLSAYVEQRSGIAICHGALVAAVLQLRLPHVAVPESTALRVGISVRSPTLVEAPSPGR